MNVVGMITLFLDTAYAIALSAETDSHHQRAIELADQIEITRVHFSRFYFKIHPSLSSHSVGSVALQISSIS